MNDKDKSVEALLEARHETYLEWGEPHPACGPEGNKLDAHVTLRATVHDCINMARRMAKAHNKPTMGNDYEFLLDFIAVNWATIIYPPKHKEKEMSDSITWMRLNDILDDLKPESDEDKENALFVMAWGDDETPYDEKRDVFLVQRLLQYNYDEYDSWNDICTRVRQFLQVLDHVGFDMVPKKPAQLRTD